VHRPVVLLSSTGSPLMRKAALSNDRVYAACLRNVSAQVHQLAADASHVVLLAGADKNPDTELSSIPGMRIEDEICCALIAARLIEHGFEADDRTRAAAERRQSEPLDVIRNGRSAAYLARSEQLDDLEFILEHVDDIDTVFTIQDVEVRAAAA
ncbi:MAG: 2-phosphosulfolactate phosphatase, partial [Actinomycetota bacterium]